MFGTYGTMHSSSYKFISCLSIRLAKDYPTILIFIIQVINVSNRYHRNNHKHKLLTLNPLFARSIIMDLFKVLKRHMKHYNSIKIKG